MIFGLRLLLLVCISLGLWYALRRLGLSSLRAWLLAFGVIVALSAFVQFGLGISYK